MTLSVTFSQVGSELYEVEAIQGVIKNYQQDFDLLVHALKTNACIHGFRFQLWEEQYVTHVNNDHERIWIEAKVKMIENGFIQSNSHWESLEHKLGHACLNRGHPKSFDSFCIGLTRDPDFALAWACPDECTDRSGFWCVKCHFVSALTHEFKLEFNELIRDLSENFLQVVKGIQEFRLIF